MNTLIRFLQFFSLGTWVGSILFFGAVVAPAAFTVLATREQAGALVGVVLARLHLIGIVAGVLYLVAAAIGAKTLAAMVRPAPLLVVAMVVLTLVSQLWVSATMAALKTQMGSVDATSVTSAARTSFDRLHQLSVRLEMAILVAGLAALAFTARKPVS